MKTKKSSLSLILALAMVFVMASGALAATAIVTAANGASKGPEQGASGDISAVNDNQYGLWALNSSDILYTGGTITTEGSSAYAVYATNNSEINGTGAIITSGDTGRGLYTYNKGDITWVGDITTYGNKGRGAYALMESSIDIIGNIVTHGDSAAGVYSDRSSYITVSGNVTTHGATSYGAVAFNGNDGEGTTATTIFVGDIVTYGDGAPGVVADRIGAELYMTGNITTHGRAHGVHAFNDGIVTMKSGTISVPDNDVSYALIASAGGTINLSDVTAECENLLRNTDADNPSGTVNATNSTLTGDINYICDTEGTLALNLTDSVWSGATDISGDLGTIDINLENSQWNVTGDTNTNGKVTADEDSKVDFNGTTDNITVIVDSIAGNPGLNVKPGDKLIIKNPAGSVESSNPDVIEVITNDDGSIEIVFNGDGEADLTYEYIDENGDIQTGTVKVVSGAGSVQASSSGGSSNCNTGVGAALFALLGLALIQKRK